MIIRRGYNMLEQKQAGFLGKGKQAPKKGVVPIMLNEFCDILCRRTSWAVDFTHGYPDWVSWSKPSPWLCSDIVGTVETVGGDRQFFTSCYEWKQHEDRFTVPKVHNSVIMLFVAPICWRCKLTISSLGRMHQNLKVDCYASASIQFLVQTWLRNIPECYSNFDSKAENMNPGKGKSSKYSRFGLGVSCESFWSLLCSVCKNRRPGAQDLAKICSTAHNDPCACLEANGLQVEWRADGVGPGLPGFIDLEFGHVCLKAFLIFFRGLGWVIVLDILIVYKANPSN